MNSSLSCPCLQPCSSVLGCPVPSMSHSPRHWPASRQVQTVPSGCLACSRTGHALPLPPWVATLLPKPMLSRAGAVCSLPPPCPGKSWFASCPVYTRTSRDQSWGKMSRAVTAFVGAYIKGSIFILLLVCFSQNKTPQLTMFCVTADHSQLMHGLLR